MRSIETIVFSDQSINPNPLIGLQSHLNLLYKHPQSVSIESKCFQISFVVVLIFPTFFIVWSKKRNFTSMKIFKL